MVGGGIWTFFNNRFSVHIPAKIGTFKVRIGRSAKNGCKPKSHEKTGLVWGGRGKMDFVRFGMFF